MPSILKRNEDDFTNLLAYAGLVLLAFELLKSMIVQPVKDFYAHTTFSGGPFVSYEADVLWRDKSEFQACLLYLRDYMKAIDSDDIKCIQSLREHRNELAHDLPERLATLKIEDYASLFRATDKALFKLSSYRTYMEIGSDPKYTGLGIDWNLVKGHEYLLYEEVLVKMQSLRDQLQ